VGRVRPQGLRPWATSCRPCRGCCLCLRSILRTTPKLPSSSPTPTPTPALLPDDPAQSSNKPHIAAPRRLQPRLVSVGKSCTVIHYRDAIGVCVRDRAPRRYSPESPIRNPQSAMPNRRAGTTRPTSLLPPYAKLNKTVSTTRCHPSASTKSNILKGSEIRTGGSIIMPMDNRMVAITMSITRNGK